VHGHARFEQVLIRWTVRPAYFSARQADDDPCESAELHDHRRGPRPRRVRGLEHTRVVVGHLEQPAADGSVSPLRIVSVILRLRKGLGREFIEKRRAKRVLRAREEPAELFVRDLGQTTRFILGGGAPSRPPSEGERPGSGSAARPIANQRTPPVVAWRMP
jgi:hypothetical protein